MLEKDIVSNVRFGDLPSNVSYHLEGQAIAVREAQLANRLITNYFTFTGLETVEEFGHTWYQLGQNPYKLFSGDCNKEAINNLRYGVELTMVKDPQIRPDIFDGRREKPIAAIFYSGGHNL